MNKKLFLILFVGLLAASQAAGRSCGTGGTCMDVTACPDGYYQDFTGFCFDTQKCCVPLVQCADRGESCKSLSCCSGLTCNSTLFDGTYLCFNSSLSLSDGSACYHDSECASGDCKDGFCYSEPAPPPSYTCTDTQGCFCRGVCLSEEEVNSSLTCAPGKVCCCGLVTICGNGIVEAGEICDQGSLNGVACVPDYGGSCQYCTNGCTWSSVQGGYCGDGTVTSGEEDCEDDNDCASGQVCSSCSCIDAGGGCTGERGGYCSHGLGVDCCDPLNCNNTIYKCYNPNLNLADGKTCYHDSECSSSNCLGGTCQSGVSCSDRGGACLSRYDCCGSLGCNTVTKKCYDSSLSLGEGATCYHGLECASENCNEATEKCSASGAPPTDPIIFYDYKNYGGASIGFSADDENIVGDGWNDKASSIKVSSGYKAVIYEHIDYGGSSYTVTSNIPDLSSIGFDNKISSVKVVSEENGQPPGQPPGSGIINLQNPLKAESFQELIDNLVNFVFSLAIVIAPLMILIAGYFFVTAAGNTEKIKKAKDLITWTVIGLVVVLLSRAIVGIIKQVFGAS